MSFKELRDKLIDSDRQAIADWEARENDWMRGPPSIEERLSFVEFRRSMLAGAVGAILSELISREEANTEAPNVEHNRRPQGVRVDGPVGPHTQESVNMLAELTATETVANEICRDIPEGYELRLCMENGAAWVTLHNADGDLIGLPDAADKTIGEQMAEALQVARNGW